MSISNNSQNDQYEDNKSRLNDQLDHKYGRGRPISNKVLEELALKRYYFNGRGLTFNHLIKLFGCSKDKAQRRLKNARIEKRDKNGKKSSILFTLDNKRTKPQQYFPTCIKAKILEDKRKNQNKLIATTGVNYNNKEYSSSSSSYSPQLHNADENQKVQSFLIQLSLLPFQPLHMHNIRLWILIDNSHYEEIEIKPSSDKNKTKIITERIGLREVVFQFHKKGSIEIEIACSIPTSLCFLIINFSK